MVTEGQGRSPFVFSEQTTISFRKAFKPFCTTTTARRHRSPFNYGFSSRVMKLEHLNGFPQQGEYLAVFISIKGISSIFQLLQHSPTEMVQERRQNHLNSGKVRPSCSVWSGRVCVFVATPRKQAESRSQPCSLGSILTTQHGLKLRTTSKLSAGGC